MIGTHHSLLGLSDSVEYGLNQALNLVEDYTLEIE